MTREIREIWTRCRGVARVQAYMEKAAQAYVEITCSPEEAQSDALLRYSRWRDLAQVATFFATAEPEPSAADVIRQVKLVRGQR
jgi:hypothetical protein